MKIPKDVHGIHKIRDSKLLSLYLSGDWTYQALAERFKISTTRVNQIIYKNRALLKIDREYEKIKRVNHLKRILKSKGDLVVDKDAVDILKELRTESDIHKSESSGSGETKIIIIRASGETSKPSTEEVSNGRVETSTQLVSRSISL